MINIHQIHALADDCPYDLRQGVQTLSDDQECLGVGADLSVATLLHAYRSGVFPWFHDKPIAWWSPNPRCVLTPSDFIPKKSLIRKARQSTWTLTTNHAFADVIQACSEPRAYADETWIGHEMIQAYTALHELGVAVSVEIWQGEPQASALIGGLYGLNIGAMFCGESMFHRATDSSKVAFWGLMQLCQRQGVALVDCQLENSHLMSLGASLMGRDEFLGRADTLMQKDVAGLGGRRFVMAVRELC